MATLWKDNWDETKERFRRWWVGRGVCIGGPPPFNPGRAPRAKAPDPGPPASVEDQWINAAWRAQSNRHRLAHSSFPAETLPLSYVNIGPGNLATAMGSEPAFAPDTVWYLPCINDPENHPPLWFNPDNRWWKAQMDIITASLKSAKGEYFVGMPDLIENFDVLASLRDAQTLLTDILLRPEWVKQSIAEINTAFYEAFDQIYDVIKLGDGSMCFEAFCLWGEGKTAKVQCDASAMLSPDQFREFVVPALSEQCAWLDHSIFHVDGSQCLRHVDALLEIEELDGIEWTPEPGQPWGGSEKWFPLYRRVLEAGKTLQVLNVQPQEVEPLLRAVGANGIYIMGWMGDEAIVNDMRATADRMGG